MEENGNHAAGRELAGWRKSKCGRDILEDLRCPSLLVLDSFRGHLMEEVKDSLRKVRTDMALLPGGLTSILQPLDVSTIHLKKHKKYLC